MTKKLMVVLFTIASVTAFAQMDEYEIETVEKNISKQASDSVQDDYFKGSNDAYDTANSPQINIYNANSNANKQNQKNKQAQDQEAEQRSKQEAVAQADSGQEFIQRANDIRNSRKNMEVGTEQKMIEKIEWSRIEDEKDRADRLFGNRLEKKKDSYDNGYEDSYKAEKVVVVEKPAYQAPAPAPYKDEVSYEAPVSSWWGEETYFAPVLGMASYNSASNVREGDAAVGLLIGKRLDTGVGIEAGFLYSTYEMDDYTLKQNNSSAVGLKDVTQYNFTLGAKYSFDMGRISPFVGALGSYTYRQFDELRVQNISSTDSNAFDAGLNVGVDVKLAKNFSIGAEYRYMRNVAFDREETKATTNQVNAQCSQTTGGVCRPLEELSYGSFLVNGKITF